MSECKYRDGRGTCSTCGGPCDIRSRNCRDCKATRPVLICPSCKEEVARELMTLPSGRRVPYCPPCRKKWHRNNKYMKKYGVTSDYYHRVLAEQQGRCGICGAEEEGRGYSWMHLDHNHETEEVRGILCHMCNMALGRLGTPELLQQAINYLDNPPARKIKG